MKRLYQSLVVASVVFFALPFCFAGNVTESVTMPASPAPALLQIFPDGEARLAPTILPEFQDYQGQSARCGEAMRGKSRKRLRDYAKGVRFTNPEYGAPKEGWIIIDGLQATKFTVPTQYRKNAKLLFTWTVRIIGEVAQTYKMSEVDPTCVGVAGTSWQKFVGGPVKSQLFVVVGGTEYPMGSPAVMTIPDFGAYKVTQTGTPPRPPQPRDPTISGSCLISPRDYPFTGTFPSEFGLRVKWINETSLGLKSETKMRNLIVTVFPSIDE